MECQSFNRSREEGLKHGVVLLGVQVGVGRGCCVPRVRVSRTGVSWGLARRAEIAQLAVAVGAVDSAQRQLGREKAEHGRGERVVFAMHDVVLMVQTRD